MTDIEHAGDPAHPDHDQWLLALGRATFSSQRLAAIAIDVLRTHCGEDFWKLLPDTMGKLIQRLKSADPVNQVPGLEAWLDELHKALTVRNDLLHALPVKDGLHRRTADDPHRVVNFYDIAELDSVAATLTAATRSGNKILYHDGGTAVGELPNPDHSRLR